MFLQALNIVKKFGGAAALGKAIGKHRTTVHRWTLPRERGGTDGLIPLNAIQKIKKAAEERSIPLSPEDWIP